MPEPFNSQQLETYIRLRGDCKKKYSKSEEWKTLEDNVELLWPHRPAVGASQAEKDDWYWVVWFHAIMPHWPLHDIDPRK